MKIKVFLIVLLSTVLWSCRKEFIIDYPPLPKKLVVNCLFTPDSVFNIQVSKLHYPDDTTDAIINNAEVILYENGYLFETLSYNSIEKSYISIKRPKSGNTYLVKVKANGFPSVVASDKVPDSIRIDSANVYISAYYDSWEERNLDIVKLYFKEDTSKDNYYEIISLKDENPEPPPHYYSFPYGITSIDPVISAEGILDQSKYLPVLSFSDKLLNENAEITFMPFLQLGGWGVSPSSYTVLRNISKNYYLFRKKWFKFLQTNGLIQPDGIAQWSNMSFVPNPADAYTNIENGLGIFASYTETIKLMNVKQ